jgi:hypothetical protein
MGSRKIRLRSACICGSSWMAFAITGKRMADSGPTWKLPCERSTKWLHAARWQASGRALSASFATRPWQSGCAFTTASATLGRAASSAAALAVRRCACATCSLDKTRRLSRAAPHDRCLGHWTAAACALRAAPAGPAPGRMLRQQLACLRTRIAPTARTPHRRVHKLQAKPHIVY